MHNYSIGVYLLIKLYALLCSVQVLGDLQNTMYVLCSDYV